MSGTTPPGSTWTPSRPPSRTQNVSPVTGIPTVSTGFPVTEWNPTISHTDWDGGAPKSKAEEDEQLLRAIHLSAASSAEVGGGGGGGDGGGGPAELDAAQGLQNLSGQYGGTVTTTTPANNYITNKTIIDIHSTQQGLNKYVTNFQPASKPWDEYDPQNWAMVPSNWAPPSAVTPATVEASRRGRTKQTPAFLVQAGGTGDGDRLGGLITILHSIPLARNALLRVADGPEPDSYGLDRNWWMGGAATAEDAEWRRVNLAHEMHRLMAFLDGTDRSYGSAAALNTAVLQATEEDRDDNKGVEARLYDVLGSSRHRGSCLPLMHCAQAEFVDGTVCDESPLVFGYTIFEGPEATVHTATLEEIWDRTMWEQPLRPDLVEWSPKLQTAVITSLGDIMVAEVRQPPNEPIAVPLMWHADRYLDTHRKAAQHLQHVWWKSNRRLIELDAMASKVMWWRDSSGQRREMVTVCHDAIQELKRQIAWVEERARIRGVLESDWEEFCDDDGNDDNDNDRKKPSVLSEAERKRIGRIQGRIKMYEKMMSTAEQWGSCE